MATSRRRAPGTPLPLGARGRGTVSRRHQRDRSSRKQCGHRSYPTTSTTCLLGLPTPPRRGRRGRSSRRRRARGHLSLCGPLPWRRRPPRAPRRGASREAMPPPLPLGAAPMAPVAPTGGHEAPPTNATRTDWPTATCCRTTDGDGASAYSMPIVGDTKHRGAPDALRRKNDRL